MSFITAKQIKVVQIARRQLGLDEDDYRAILREIARVQSSKQLTQRGFEDVMAHFEHRGFNRTRGGQQKSFARDHFRQRKWHRGIFASTREVHMIRELLKQVGYKLPGLCLRFSDGRTDDVTKLNPREAYNLIEMLKAKLPRAAEGPAARDAKDGAGTDAGDARTGVGYRDVVIGSPTGWGESQPDEAF